MNANSFHWERITAIATIAIAVVAAGSSFWQAKLLAEHNRLSVMPRLEVANNLEDDHSFTILLTNNGMGPADVLEVEYFVDGKSYGEDRDKAMDVLGLRKGCAGYGALKRFYKIDDRQKVLSSENRPGCESFKPDALKILNTFALRLRYRSIYGDELVLDTR